MASKVGISFPKTQILVAAVTRNESQSVANDVINFESQSVAKTYREGLFRSYYDVTNESSDI